jgi:hypothetical protein
MMQGNIRYETDETHWEIYWDGDIMIDCPVVYFHATFLADPPPWWTVIFPERPADAQEGDEVDVTGTLLKLPPAPDPDPDFDFAGRVWRLTGRIDERHGGYEGRWPD